MGKFSISERDELLVDYQRSGLKISAFCRLRGVNVKTFGNWKRQFIDGIAPRSPRPETPKVIASQNGCDYALCPPAIHPLRVIDDTAQHAQKLHKLHKPHKPHKPHAPRKFQNNQEPKESPNTKSSLESPTITLHFPNGITAHITDIPTQEITQLINNYRQCSH